MAPPPGFLTRPRRRVLLVAVGVLALAGLALAMVSCRSLLMASAKAAVRSQFPDVSTIDTAELARRLEDPETPAPLLLDVRTRAEYEVSHLPGAVHVPPGGDDLSALDAVDRDRPVVTYCSIGWRSAELAAELERRGFTDVVNLEGSIFEWANQGRPLVADGEPVSVVHPYDATWGRLLAPSRRADGALTAESED